MKPVTITFALVGLYLIFERGYTGREVHRAHMLLGKLQKKWPRFESKIKGDEITVAEILQTISKDNFKEVLSRWGKSVWDSWKPEHENVKKLVDRYLNVS
jgi:hypothetical protein